MSEKLRRGCLIVAVTGVMVIAACSGGSSHPAANGPAPAGNGGVNEPGVVQNQTPTTVVVTITKSTTCHSQHRAGKNSDAIFSFDIDVPDGTVVTVTFTSNQQQGNLITKGVVKSKKLLVRLGVVAFGEAVTLEKVEVTGKDALSGGQVQGTKPPLMNPYNVPDNSGTDCSLDQPEQDANASLTAAN